MLLSLSLLSVLWLFTSFSNASYLLRKRATICNGRAELCDRPYGNVTFLAAHDSFAVSSDVLALARTQAVDVQSQMAIGARMLQGQAHWYNNQLRFCHTSCLLFDGGLVVDYLIKVKAFLDANPNEVFTLLFTNPDRVSIPAIWKPAFDAAGITPLAYVPPSRTMKRSDWPTLGQLIDANKRVIVFLDAGADGSNGGIVDFILPEFQMIWEDPFSSTNKSFPCSIQRTSGPLSNDDHMHLINHNLNVNLIPIGEGVLISDPADAPTTNGVPSILMHANSCAPLALGRAPNFVIADYINIGEPMKAINQLNGFE